MLNKHNIFRLSMLSVLFMACVIVASPLMNVNGLIYPVRIDSSFFAQREALNEKYVLENGIDTGAVFIYNPGELEILYQEFEIEVDDNINLRGWITGDTTHESVASVLIIPDISESRIHYINDLQQFRDRGFSVCVVELRGQGVSDGDRYNVGELSANDVSLLLDELELIPGFENLCVMGSRTGAAVALQTALNDERVKVLVLKNPFTSFGNYFSNYVAKYWGPWAGLLNNVLKREFAKNMGFHPDSLNCAHLAAFLEIPTLCLAADFYTENVANETVVVYNACSAPRKRLIIDRTTINMENGFGNSKNYYDRLAAYIASSMPPRQVRSKFKKLVELTPEP